MEDIVSVKHWFEVKLAKEKDLSDLAKSIYETAIVLLQCRIGQKSSRTLKWLRLKRLAFDNDIIFPCGSFNFQENLKIYTFEQEYKFLKKYYENLWYYGLQNELDKMLATQQSQLLQTEVTCSALIYFEHLIEQLLTPENKKSSFNILRKCNYLYNKILVLLINCPGTYDQDNLAKKLLQNLRLKIKNMAPLSLKIDSIYKEADISPINMLPFAFNRAIDTLKSTMGNSLSEHEISEAHHTVVAGYYVKAQYFIKLTRLCAPNRVKEYSEQAIKAYKDFLLEYSIIPDIIGYTADLDRVEQLQNDIQNLYKQLPSSSPASEKNCHVLYQGTDLKTSNPSSVSTVSLPEISKTRVKPSLSLRSHP